MFTLIRCVYPHIVKDVGQAFMPTDGPKIIRLRSRELPRELDAISTSAVRPWLSGPPDQVGL